MRGVADQDDQVGAGLFVRRAQRFGDLAGVVLPGVLDLELEVPLGPVRRGRAVNRPLPPLHLPGVLPPGGPAQFEVRAGPVDVRHETDGVLAGQLQQRCQAGQRGPAGDLALRPPGEAMTEHHFPSGGEDHSARRVFCGADVHQGVAHGLGGGRVSALLLEGPAHFPCGQLTPLGTRLVVLSGVEVHGRPRAGAVEERFQE